MSTWVDREYAEKVFCTLPRYRRVSGAEFKLNARCPVCGDSQKDQMKARFWAYPCHDSMRVHCFNCDLDQWFSKFLKEYDEDIYREFILEKRKATTGDVPKPVDISPKIKAVMPIIEKLNFCDRLDSLSEDHPIVKYVSNRCIPKSAFSRLWFTTQWPKLVNSINPGTYKNERPEPRLVIPIFNASKQIESFQGRALRADAPQKYITIKAHSEATKIYGLDTVEGTKDVFVMEGPIDSLFVDNAIAITGGSLALDMVPFPDKRIWVMDNEPRHEDTIARMSRLIDLGEKVVFWDKAPWPSKDINDMIKDDGASQEDIIDYLRNNYAQGLMAKLRLQKYSKI